MASHHHHHNHHDGRCHNHCETIPLPATYNTTPSPFCCADSSPCCVKTNQPSPPNLDHLLRLIVSYLQNQQQRETQCSCETTSSRFNGVRRQSFVLSQQQRKKRNVQLEYDSLLRKIDDLDLSLSRFHETRRDSYSTLRDSAARVIQTHFRSYLVFRSKSLRQLKELATIKSSLLSLKSSVSGKTQFPFEAVSREATDLLLQLDSIEGRVDPMTRDGKRSLSRELVRFLQYIDECAAKRREIVRKSAKDLSFTGKCKGSSGERLKKRMGTIYVTSNGDEENVAELEEFLFVSDDGQGIPIVSAEKGRKVGCSKSRVGALRQGDRVKTPVAKTVKFGKNRNVYELTSSAEDDDGEEIMMMSRDDSRSGSRSGVVIKGNGGKKRVVKTVSFDEDGNVYKVYGGTPEASVSEGDDSYTSGSNNEIGDGYNEVEDLKYVPKENNEGSEEEETHSENEEEFSSEGSKEKQVIDNVSHAGRNEHKQEEFQLRKSSSMFSPPMPLKMEP